MLLPQIYKVACHTDHIGENSTFVAINGFANDGHQFIDIAIKKGAKRIVCQQNSLNLPHVTLKELESIIPKEKIIINNGIEFIYVEDSRKALAILSAKELGYPAKKLKIIGVTGTKGKTTTTFMIEHTLNKAGIKTALFGSIKNKISDREEKSFRATQQSDYIQFALSECVKAGVEVVILEVSSHALSLDRVYGIEFDIACFTNFSSDHMDFYKDMDEYFRSKCKLIEMVKKEGALIFNSDDEWWNNIYKQLKSIPAPKTISISSKNTAEYQAAQNCYKLEIINNSSNYLELKLAGIIEELTFRNYKIFGEFNAYNFSMAAAACKELGLDTKTLSQTFANFEGTPGRLQLHILKNQAKAFVDYAHNQYSMRAILKTLRPLTNDLIVIFGCGGEKDKLRRPAMGNIAGILADKIIITSDNVRSEDPMQIAQDIVNGVNLENKNKIIIELDRFKAINMAVNISSPTSIIAILGKGHEDYLIINNKTIYFDDFKEISKY